MLQEFRDELIRSAKSEHTVRAYIDRVNDFLTWLQERYGEENPSAITTLDTREYQSYCLNVKKYRPSGIQQRMSAVKAYCGFLQAKGLLSTNPALDVKAIKSVKRDSAPDVLTKSELHRFRREVHKAGNLRDIAILELLLQTGVRVSELVNIDVNDISISERKGILVVREGKGRKYREIPLSTDVRKAFADYLKVRPLTTDKKLLQGQRGGLTTDAVSKMLKKYARRVGLQDRIHPHLFRHQLATELLRNKKQDIALVAELLGHSSLNTTMIYTRPSADEKAKALEDLFT